jgi:hypothetical protein
VIVKEPVQQLAFSGGADQLLFSKERAFCHGHTVTACTTAGLAPEAGSAAPSTNA